MELQIGQKHAARCANRENGVIAGHGACVCHCRCPGTWWCSLQQEFLQQQPRLMEAAQSTSLVNLTGRGTSLVDLTAAVKYHLWEC